MFGVGLIMALFLSEVIGFMQFQKTTEIVINASSGNEKVAHRLILT